MDKVELSVGGGGNKSPKKGPYNSKTDSWGDLKLFTVGALLGDDFHHSDLYAPGSSPLSVTEYHHWAIIGQDSLSSTVSLYGDIVVFPGATLTIQPGTVIDFDPGQDRHQYSTHGADRNRSEIFVYGTLITNGTVSDSVRFQKKSDPAWSGDYAWGGIRVMPGGSVDLNHTSIRDMSPPPVRPIHLRAQPGDRQVTLRWSDPVVNDSVVDDPTITGWAYRTKAGDGDWGGWETIPGGRSIHEHTVSNLDHGVLHSFEVCAVNAAGEGPASEIIVEVALINVAYDAASYDVLEGGDPVEITVRLTPVADRTVVIPIQAVSSGLGIVGLAGEDDYRLSSSTLSFVAGEDTQQFTITAVSNDDDTAEETLILGFVDSSPLPIDGHNSSLPAGVRAGDPARTTITIYKDSRMIPPSGLSVESELSNLRVLWNAASGISGVIGLSSGVTGYKLEYQSTPVGKDTWSDFTLAANTDANTRSYRHSVRLDRLYRYRVQSLTTDGASRWSAVVPAAGATVLPDGSPDIDLMAVDNQNVTVRWECPNYKWCDPLNGASVAPLRLQSRMQSGSGAWTDWVGVASSEMTTITHPVSTLNQALVHRFQTRVVNASGRPGSGSISAVVVPLRAQAGDGTVQLGWDAPGRGVDSWQYRFKAGSAAWGAWQGVPERDWSTLSHAVSGLMNGVRYQFQVQAMYRGKVKVVSFIQSATPVGTLSLTASRGDGQVALSWTAPANSSTIAGYQVRQRISDSGQDWSSWSPVLGGISARSKTVTGLTNNVTYQFQVQALNNEGSSVAVSNIVSATPRAIFSFVPPRVMKTATVGLQFIFNRPNPINGTGTITYATTSTGSGLTATRTGISGTPTTADSYDFTWTATDGAGNTAIFTLTLTVRSQSSAPSFDDDRVSYSAQAGSTVNETLPEAEGADSYETSGTVPGYVTVNTTTRAISIQPENTHVGDARFTWRARNTHGTDDLTVNVEVTAIPTVPPPGPVRNLSAAGGSVSGSIAVSWDAPNTGGTPDLYRVEYRQGSTPWRAGGTTTRTSLSIGHLVGGSNYSIQVRAENSGGNGIWQSTTATATNGTQTQYAYRLHPSGTTAPTFTASASTVPTGWYSSRQTPTSTARYEWRISRTRPTGGSWSNWGSATVVSTYPETQYAYRASQTAPLFDAPASGIPDNWSSSEITWTDAAPRVWWIGRTRPSGGTWSEWGNLEKYSERPAAQPVSFYHQAVNNPGAPLSTTDSATPSNWEESNPGATTTLNVWQTERSRPAGDTHYQFTTPRISEFATGTTPPETEYAYRASQTAPLFDAAASDTPDNWSSGELTWTDAAPRVWSIRRTRPSGGSWSAWGHLEKYSERPAASATFYRRASSAPSTPGTQTDVDISTPSAWQTTPPTATATQGVWTTTANRAKGETPWVFTVPTQETPPTSGTAPGLPRNFDADTGSPLTAGSIDLDWDAPTRGGTPTGYRVEYRFSNGSWLLGATPTLTNVSLILPRAGALYQFHVRAENSAGNSGWVETTGTTSGQAQPPETEYAYRLHTSGTTAPTFTASASTVPTGWFSSRQTPTSTASYEWRISRTRPAGGSWSSWGSATVVSRYTERQTAYKRNDSGTTAPAFSSTASGPPYGWSSSQPSPTSSNRYVWSISRSRPAGGSWSSWGSATVVSRYTERQTAYKRNDSGTTAPAFSATASGTPYGWSSSQPSPTSSNRYVWSISRSRPAGGSWSSWGSATVVSRYTERQTAYKRNDSGTTAPAFSATASGTPYGWSSSQPSPTSSNRYVWSISRSRPAGGSWSSWGSASVVSRYTERQTAYKRNDSGTTAPAFSSTASGTPYGWSSSQPSPTSSNRYVWSISRSRPAGGSWSSWGSASVVSRYTERQTAFRLHTSGTTAPTFTASASTVPTGWFSSRQTPHTHARYEWRISRTRPAGGSWSSWGSATVVSKYTERQTAFRLHTSGTTAPSFSASASGVPSGWSSTQPSPDPYVPYVWRISRTRPAGESWSNWGGATVVNTWTASTGRYRDGLKRLGNSYLQPPAFTGIPTGWSSARRTPTLSNRYEWRIRRARLAGGSWSNWGSG